MLAKNKDKKPSYQLFQAEDKVLADALHLLSQEDVDINLLRKAYSTLTKRYESLLEEVKIHTKVGDKLQAKLHTINEELEEAKHNLEDVVAQRTTELKQANIDLLAINEELDSFVYRAAHDIRGPLATLLGLCNLAKIEVTDIVALNYVDLLQKTAIRLDTILSRLMIINKLKSQSVFSKRLNVQQLIEEVIAEHANRKEQFVGVRFRIDIEQNFDFYSDKDILELILYNLLENAANTLTTNASERIAPEIINIKVAPKSEYFEIFITHKGYPIPLEVSDKLFNMFYKSNEKAEATGLKLYTAKRAVEKLKGRIWLVESEKERTTFGVAIPY